MTPIRLVIDDPQLAEQVRDGGPSLRSLCQKEVDAFDAYLRRYGAEYAEGLAKFERLAIEGYIYQKIRGHLETDLATKESGASGSF